MKLIINIFQDVSMFFHRESRLQISFTLHPKEHHRYSFLQPLLLKGHPLCLIKKDIHLMVVHPFILNKKCNSKGWQDCFPGGGSYQVLVLPDVETMTPELVAKNWNHLLRMELQLLAILLLKSPSLVNYPECDIAG